MPARCPTQDRAALATRLTARRDRRACLSSERPQHRRRRQRAGYLIDLSDEQTVAGLVIVVREPAPPPAADQAGLVIDVTPNPSS